MDIKRTGPKKPLDPIEKSGPVEKPSGEFGSKLRADKTGGTSKTSSSAALAELKARFSKSDLDDGAKVEKVIHSAIDEFVLGELPQNMQLPAADRKVVADWMAKDPVIRGRLMNLLRKTLE